MPPVVRRHLKIKPGDIVQFTQNEKGEVLLQSVSAGALQSAQAAFAGAAEAMGLKAEGDVQALVDEVRYGNRR